MSEWEAHVYCTCFQDGLVAIDPPFPRSELMVNRFGVVTLVGSTDHSEDPEALWCWRVGMTVDDPVTDEGPQPCMHDDMKLIDEIFYWPGSYYHAGQYPAVTRILAKKELPLLSELVDRPPVYDFESGGVWVQAGEAPALLKEVRELRKHLVTDDRGGYGFGTILESLLEASITTGNPIITHYNGIIDGAW